MSILSDASAQISHSGLETSFTLYFIFAVACLVPVILFYNRDQGHSVPGCRLLSLRTPSNLTDEHEERYSGPDASDGNSVWWVKSLWTYPIKSCRGVELDAGNITGIGMEYDRRFSFAQLTSKFPASLEDPKDVKAQHKWKFITQRTFAAMANIKTEVWVPDPSSPTYSEKDPNIQSGGAIVIKFPYLRTGSMGYLWDMLTLFGIHREHVVQIPFSPTKEQISEYGYETEDLEIWKDSPKSLRVASTEDSTPWIQDLRHYLGITNHLALFRISPSQPREVYRCAPRQDELGYQSVVGFQDAYPLHILNLASVHDVAKRMNKGAPPLSALNFRPNIVITGGQAYAEDSWKRIEIGEYDYHVACRTVRCLLPNVNPATGIRHGSEPNRTLKSFRRIDGGDPKNACLGMQMVPAVEQCKVKVGDHIHVSQTGEHFYLKQ